MDLLRRNPAIHPLMAEFDTLGPVQPVKGWMLTPNATDTGSHSSRRC
jgi:hypothetical protein